MIHPSWVSHVATTNQTWTLSLSLLQNFLSPPKIDTEYSLSMLPSLCL